MSRHVLTFAVSYCIDYTMDMGRIKKPLGTAIDPQLHGAVDEWVKQNPPWRKVDVIEAALREFLAKRAAETEK